MSTSASTPTTVPDIPARPAAYTQAWRDLHWLIHSPDLLSATAGLPLAAWPATSLPDIARWLTLEGEAPQVLAADFHTSYRRLGLYAEALLGTALQHVDGIQLLAQHTPIHLIVSRGTGAVRQTVGELDYVWRDRDSGQVWHWELAVKCYLYLPQTEQAGVVADRFVGLQQRDTLARKTGKLRDQQLRLSATPEVYRQLGMRIDDAAAYVKGWLFYPLHGNRWDDYLLPETELSAEAAGTALLNPRHLRGWWLTHADFVKRLQTTAGVGSPGLRWRILSRMQWLSHHEADIADTLDTAALLAQLQAWFSADAAPTGQRPGLLIVALAPPGTPASKGTIGEQAMPDNEPTWQSGATVPIARKQACTEIHRGFVVANDWARDAPARRSPMAT
ncbi:DUF1853 family protein [Advenella sp. S44]|uniref:DUF1853 family protein n=1 Tax=Advenella sp. S44 TaxID=1982755 RepID=UPI0013748226|nr:DUF1853 family protein [Advenella sp. S44]